MCQAQELPGGETLWQGEGEGDLACGGVAVEPRHEGGGLVEVGADGGRGSGDGLSLSLSVFLGSTITDHNLLIQDGIVCCHIGHRGCGSDLHGTAIIDSSFLHDHTLGAAGLGHHHTIGTHQPTGGSEEVETVHPLVIEAVEGQARDAIVLHGEVEVHAGIALAEEVLRCPVGEQQTVCTADRHLPGGMGRQLVEGGIIDDGHEVGSGGRAVWSCETQCPRLLVAGMQSVAEGGPLPAQLGIWACQAQGLCLLICLSVLDKGKAGGEAVAVFVLIGDLKEAQLVGEGDQLVLDDAAGAHEAVVEGHIGEAAAHLHAGGVSGIEGVGGAVEPAGGVAWQAGVCEGEEVEAGAVLGGDGRGGGSGGQTAGNRA